MYSVLCDVFDVELMLRTDNIPVQVSNTKFLARSKPSHAEVHDDPI